MLLTIISVTFILHLLIHCMKLVTNHSFSLSMTIGLVIIKILSGTRRNSSATLQSGAVGTRAVRIPSLHIPISDHPSPRIKKILIGKIFDLRIGLNSIYLASWKFVLTRFILRCDKVFCLFLSYSFSTKFVCFCLNSRRKKGENSNKTL